MLLCMEIPSGFTYAFPKLEEAIEALAVGKGEIRGRLFLATKRFVITQAEDFPQDFRQEHSRLLEALTHSSKEKSPNQGTIKSVHDLRRKAASALAQELFSFY